MGRQKILNMVASISGIYSALNFLLNDNGTVHQLFIDFRKAYDSVRREVLYSILF
jgi:hypothetical protein